MLYDNALLVDLIQLVWQDTRSPIHATRVAETVGWMLRDMRVEGGGFASSFDADSEGVEGRFYVWSASEIDDVLDPDADTFKTAYGVTPGGNWEGVNILNRQPPVFVDGALEDRLAKARAMLFARRERRVKPGLDDKVLADWNGLAIAALARAGACFDVPPWIDAAREAFAFVFGHLLRDSRLRHSWCRGEARHPATLDDHASLARAALALHEATFDQHYVAEAERLVDAAGAHYWDEAEGGYFLTADDTSDVITRTKTARDGATPSGNGMMAEVLARLYHLTGREQYAARARAVIAAFSGDMAGNFFALPTLLNASDLLDHAVEIVIAGPSDSAETRALARTVYGCSLPNRIVQIVPPGLDLPSTHPAHGRGHVDGKPAAYLCTGGTCSLPVTTPDTLLATLRSRVPQPA
jgi:uncharacterized protein YyaL (SSP411 family)